jgi:hypothetical protein
MRLLSVLVFSLVLFGCGAGGYTGVFYSQATSALRGQASTNQERIVFTLTQSGSSVSGSFSGEYSGIAGQFTGTTNGDSLSNFTMQLPANSGSCTTLTGSGTYASYNMTLNYNAQCGGTAVAGSIVAVKKLN